MQRTFDHAIREGTVHKRKLEDTGTEKHEVVQQSCQVRCYPLLGGLREAALFRKNASVEYLSICDSCYMRLPTSCIGFCSLKWRKREASMGE